MRVMSSLKAGRRWWAVPALLAAGLVPGGIVLTNVAVARDPYCGHCGARTASAGRFCTGCGQSLRGRSGDSESASPEAAGDLAVLEESLRRLATGDPAAAIPPLEDLCRRRPEWAVASAYLGTAYFGVFRVSDARDLLEHAVRLDPESFICRVQYGHFLARLGFFDQAAEHVQAAMLLAAPSEAQRHFAAELLRMCKERSRDLFYRKIAAPRLPRLPSRWARRGADDQQATATSTT